MILSIETTTSVCSVALHQTDGQLLALQELHTDRPHAEQLTLLVGQLCKGLRPAAVAVSAGPGSYTGLRIGASVAKGLCMGWDVPLIAVDTLQAMAWAMRQALPARLYANQPAVFVPLLDARRMEVYTAVFDAQLVREAPTQAQVIADEAFFAPYLERGNVFLGGDGAAKCQTMVQHPRAHWLLGHPHTTAAAVGALAASAWAAGRLADVAAFEPFYLKSFAAKISQKTPLKWD
ncbi:MAG: tRNA (adenosine(37)-N6)-threonylcarbamoyltransferase complex dimerization subunit type 1 TsaB [Bernardetiaceae bacterium]